MRHYLLLVSLILLGVIFNIGFLFFLNYVFFISYNSIYMLYNIGYNNTPYMVAFFDPALIENPVF